MEVSGTESFGNGLLYAGFNQDEGCFACGLENGFRIYNSDPLKLKEREVCIWDDVRKEAVISLELATDVKSVRLRRDRIVVVLEGLIKVYSFTANPQQLQVYETTPNPRGLCALCPSSQRSLLAFPGRGFGDVQLVHLGEPDRMPLIISAHEGHLSTLCLNPDGTLLATASEKGTLVRVFDTEEGAKLYELRRGAQPARIFCINFSSDSRQLCVSSDHGTVHIFDLDESNTKTLANKKLVPKYFRSLTSVCQVRLPSGGSGAAKKKAAPAICAFGPEPNTLIVLCADGSYFKFAYKPKGDFSRLNYAMFLEMSD